MSNEKILDVRTMIPRERHPKIFGLFDQLGVNDGFVLVNDHDPKPLFYQFQAERADQFGWEYLETGPETWRVRIARVKKADPHATGGCCGVCGGH